MARQGQQAHPRALHPMRGQHVTFFGLGVISRTVLTRLNSERVQDNRILGDCLGSLNSHVTPDVPPIITHLLAHPN